MCGFSKFHNKIVVRFSQFLTSAEELRNSVVNLTEKNMLINESLHVSENLSSISQNFTLSEVAQHGDSSDCWIIIYDRVYQITDFLDKHPGGKDLLLEYAGKDATFAFRGTGHSKLAIQSLKQYEIGELIPQQQIFRKNSTISIKDLPE